MIYIIRLIALAFFRAFGIAFFLIAVSHMYANEWQSAVCFVGLAIYCELWGKGEVAKDAEAYR